ncbi:glycosyltransferase, partial [Oscillochloris sp. ZM17-4]|uniref:glycosyltransferase n=1 Tax=Oscillochloris sp. ZM17-4 TaxID=2866714 RepID=UPI001C7330F5|nr:glycosyltransferase [Oscillochloris sp. ZM17-4]
MISLVCTVRDEADNIAALLDSMLAQTRLPDEIVVNDCGSRDSTAAIVESYVARDMRVRLVRGGHNIPSGRNSAVAQARGELIACTDAGLTLDPGWLEAIIAPLERGEADLVGGFFTPAPASLFELTLGAVNYREASEVDGATFLPFGKSMAFRRELWARVGGFPEWASHCEDLLFDFAAERAGCRRAFAPDAVVRFRPRPSLRAFARQYFLYARGDGAAGLWPRRHLARYLAYLGLLGTLWAMAARPRARLPGAAMIGLGAAGYTRGPYRRLWGRLAGRGPAERAYALALVPAIRLVGDVAKMAGYPAGLRRRRMR